MTSVRFCWNRIGALRPIKEVCGCSQERFAEVVLAATSGHCDTYISVNASVGGFLWSIVCARPKIGSANEVLDVFGEAGKV